MIWGSWFRRAHVASRTSRPSLNRRPRRRIEALEDRRLLVIDPGFAYVDANNNADFDAGDVQLTAANITDGFFDTDVAEGPNYTTPIQGAGLVIPTSVGPLTGVNLVYRADGLIISGVNLTASNDVLLTSRNSLVNLVNTTSPGTPLSVTAGDDVEITAGTQAVVNIQTLQAGDDIELEAGTTIEAFAASFTSTGRDGEVQLVAGQVINAQQSVIQALGSSAGVEVEAGGDANFQSASITAGKKIDMDAKGSIQAFPFLNNPPANFQVTSSKGEIELEARVAVDLQSGTFVALQKIDIEAGNVAAAVSAILRSLGSDGEIEIDSDDAINLESASIQATKKIDAQAGGVLFAVNAILRTTASSGEIELEGQGAGINLMGAEVRAAKKIDLVAKAGDINVVNASVASLTGSTKGEITIKAKNNVFVQGAVLKAAKKLTISGTQVGVPADTTNGTLP